MDKTIGILIEDTKVLIREKRAMYSGFEEMAPYIAFLDDCSSKVWGSKPVTTWTQVTNLRCDIIENEKRFVREAGIVNPEAGRKIRLMQEEAYQKKWGIKFINSSLPALPLFFIEKERRITKDRSFHKLLNRCSARKLCGYCLTLFDEVEVSESEMRKAIRMIQCTRPAPSATEYIMLEEREDSDLAYMLDKADSSRHELENLPLPKVLGCLIPYDISIEDDLYMFAALVLREMMKGGIKTVT